MIDQAAFQPINDNLWELRQTFRPDMRVPARIYASQRMLTDILKERAVDQLVNVATLPGIARYALAMPDIHQGYGFPVGGVAAIRTQDGVISPGGIGYDINCGVRLLLTTKTHQEIKDRLLALGKMIQQDVPSGVGRRGSLVLSPSAMDDLLNRGIQWAVDQEYALPEETESIEEQGWYRAADPDCVPQRAKDRGSGQLGTIGGGNHFLEIQEIVDIFDASTAKQWGLFPGQVAIMIHTGSRGLGHETCTHYVELMNRVMPHYGIRLVDRELACAPFNSKEGKQYLAAMAAASNFAWVNRQVITFRIRNAWKKIVGDEPASVRLLYDVSHNNAKLETYDGIECIVHRKGATRAFVDQPVLIPGSMGTSSYVLAGTQGAIEESFGSTCHGAGRRMSRTKARQTVNPYQLQQSLKQHGILLLAGSRRGVSEEAPIAYKDIDQVVDVVSKSGIARKIARLNPLLVIIG